MLKDRDRDNPYQSPCADEADGKPSPAFQRNRAADMAFVGGVRGSVIGAATGGGIAALLGGCVILWRRFAEHGDLIEIPGIEAMLSETVGAAGFGAILGAISGLLIGTSLGIIAGRTSSRFRGRFLVLSVTMSAACGLGWSAVLGLISFDESHAWRPVLQILATSLVILTAAMGGAWLAVRIAETAWGRADLGSLPKSEAKS